MPTVWNVFSMHLFLVHSNILQIPFQNSQSLWSLPQSSSFLLPTRTSFSLWFHSTFHNVLLLYMENRTILWFIMQGRDLVFFYVPRFLAQGLSWVGACLLSSWYGPGACVTLRINMNWRTRNTIFCCVRVKKVPLLREKFWRINCIKVIPEFCSVSN